MKWQNVRIRSINRWSKKAQMTDADMIDVALCLANSYFDGTLMQMFKETHKANMETQTRRGHPGDCGLFFGCTAEFDKGGMTIRLIGNDPDLKTFAIQQLV